MNVSEMLQSISSRNELITVDAPEAGEGATVAFRTRLSVADVLALPENWHRLPGFAQNAIIFRLLARDPNGRLPPVGDDEFAGADAMFLSEVVERSGLRDRVFAQLRAGAEDAKRKPGKPKADP